VMRQIYRMIKLQSVSIGSRKSDHIFSFTHSLILGMAPRFASALHFPVVLIGRDMDTVFAVHMVPPRRAAIEQLIAFRTLIFRVLSVAMHRHQMIADFLCAMTRIEHFAASRIPALSPLDHLRLRILRSVLMLNVVMIRICFIKPLRAHSALKPGKLSRIVLGHNMRFHRRRRREPLSAK